MLKVTTDTVLSFDVTRGAWIVDQGAVFLEDHRGIQRVWGPGSRAPKSLLPAPRTSWDCLFVVPASDLPPSKGGSSRVSKMDQEDLMESLPEPHVRSRPFPNPIRSAL